MTQLSSNLSTNLDSHQMLTERAACFTLDKQAKSLPHCNNHEKYNYLCGDCIKLYSKYRHEWTKQSPYYCKICKFSMSKYYKNRHEKTERHQYLLNMFSMQN